MLWGIYSAIYGEVKVSVEKCVVIKGDYVKKQQSCFISVTLKLLDPTTYVYLVYAQFITRHLYNRRRSVSQPQQT